MDIYDKLGIKKLVDCAGTYTIIGGSRMSENTLRAMAEAAANHVMIRDLQKAIYPRIAELTHNDDAKVTAGAMAGVCLTIATCISKHFNRPFRYIKKEDIQRSEVIIHRAFRNPYDRGLDLLGVKLVEIDKKTGKFRLSMRALQPKPDGYIERERAPRPPRRDNDRERAPRRDDNGPRRDNRNHRDSRGPRRDSRDFRNRRDDRDEE